MKTFVNKQIKNVKAMEYIIYMMVGSYFKSAECKTKSLERQLFLYYKELGYKEQTTKEDNCIRFIEHDLLKKLPRRYLKENVKVAFKTDEVSGLNNIIFSGTNWKMVIRNEANDKKPFTYEVYARPQAA